MKHSWFSIGMLVYQRVRLNYLNYKPRKWRTRKWGIWKGMRPVNTLWKQSAMSKVNASQVKCWKPAALTWKKNNKTGQLVEVVCSQILWSHPFLIATPIMNYKLKSSSSLELWTQPYHNGSLGHSAAQKMAVWPTGVLQLQVRSQESGILEADRAAQRHLGQCWVWP